MVRPDYRRASNCLGQLSNDVRFLGFEAYGYRRVDAELRHRGIVVNTKEIRRLMREHALNPTQFEPDAWWWTRDKTGETSENATKFPKTCRPNCARWSGS